jgi:hypothetical protein
MPTAKHACQNMLRGTLENVADLSDCGGTLLDVPLRTVGGKWGETDETLNESAWLSYKS